MVRGFAAATCSINASWFSGSERLGRSVPSLIHSYANTMATSDFFARAAATWSKVAGLLAAVLLAAVWPLRVAAWAVPVGSGASEWQPARARARARETLEGRIRVCSP